MDYPRVVQSPILASDVRDDSTGRLSYVASREENMEDDFPALSPPSLPSCSILMFWWSPSKKEGEVSSKNYGDVQKKVPQANMFLEMLLQIAPRQWYARATLSIGSCCVAVLMAWFDPWYRWPSEHRIKRRMKDYFRLIESFLIGG